MEQTLTLSDEAYEQATIYELGKPVSEYPSQADTEKMKIGNVMVSFKETNIERNST